MSFVDFAVATTQLVTKPRRRPSGTLCRRRTRSSESERERAPRPSAPSLLVPLRYHSRNIESTQLIVDYRKRSNSKQQCLGMEHENSSSSSYAMQAPMENHQVALTAICAGSVVLGVPLAINALWHLQGRKEGQLL